MAATDELTKLIDNLVEQKTFGLDALGPIKDLRDKAATQESQLRASQREVQQNQNDLRARDVQIANLRAEVKDWTQRTAELENRERKVFDLEKASAVAMASSAVWSDAFHSIFKNTIVREGVQHSTPIATQLQGTGGSYVQNYETRQAVVRETE